MGCLGYEFGITRPCLDKFDMGFAAFLVGVLKVATQVGRAFVGVVAPAVRQVVATAKKIIDGLVMGAGQGMREKPQSEMERNERELQAVNEEIMWLKGQWRSHSGLNDRQKQRWHELKARREALNGEISAIDEVVTAKEVVTEEKNFRPIGIDDATAHILQYHIGQNSSNKRCDCGRAMVLQWNRATSTAGLKDFFWGCSGWYVTNNSRPACTLRQPLQHDELNLFVNANRPEFEISSSELTLETLNPVKARRIRQALDSVRDSHRKKRMGIATYRCPIHGESLRLQRKNQANDAVLDEYFLGCPHWLPNNAGCNFLVKLKSAAQISSVLDTEQNIGILRV